MNEFIYEVTRDWDSYKVYQSEHNAKAEVKRLREMDHTADYYRHEIEDFRPNLKKEIADLKKNKEPKRCSYNTVIRYSTKDKLKELSNKYKVSMANIIEYSIITLYKKIQNEE